jgi:phosphohistidine phosphatase
MKKLTLIRHAKSGWRKADVTDFDRPLDDHGRQNAPMIGKRLAQRDCRPDLLICSPAKRALATAEVIAAEIGYPPEKILVDARMYGADIIQLLDIIQTLDGAHNHVMCIGHNPGLTDLANYLSPQYIGSLPTCAVVDMTFDTETWMLIGHIEPTQVYYDDPLRLRAKSGG